MANYILADLMEIATFAYKKTQMLITAIIILFNDDNQEAENNIISLSKQVDNIYLIDNSSTSFENRFGNLHRVNYIPLYQNRGIAAAQNIGIGHALKDGSEFILFADPDSKIEDGTVEKLVKKFQSIQQYDPNIGGIGPLAFNTLTQTLISFKHDLIMDWPEWHAKQLTYLMNSSSLISAQLFEIVGMMWEDLFIDGVDSEWCWRASAMVGAHFYQDQQTTIYHSLGRDRKKVGNKIRSITSSKRLFYQYRNFIWLCRKQYVPRKWIYINGLKYLVKILYYPLFIKPHFSNFKNIMLGIHAGIKNNRK